jgi:hypothetical protein
MATLGAYRSLANKEKQKLAPISATLLKVTRMEKERQTPHVASISSHEGIATCMFSESAFVSSLISVSAIRVRRRKGT